MTTALDKIIAYKADEVADLKARTSEPRLLEQIRSADPCRGFSKRLEDVASAGQNALICEIKRKSPSAGDILLNADPVSIAKEYERAGAACLSILTDGPSFGGTLGDLVQVRSAVALPVLRKDFMIDPIQILEARAHNADCILIIMSALSDSQASELQAVAWEQGMDALVEVHDQNELDRAQKISARLVGVNNRDLKAMKTDLGVSERLADGINDHGMISESGVRNVSDILRLRRSGYSRFLIGESLMKETDRELFVSQLVNTTID